jgi:hypothetical protein
VTVAEGISVPSVVAAVAVAVVVDGAVCDVEVVPAPVSVVLAAASPDSVAGFPAFAATDGWAWGWSSSYIFCCMAAIAAAWAEELSVGACGANLSPAVAVESGVT